MRKRSAQIVLFVVLAVVGLTALSSLRRQMVSPLAHGSGVTIILLSPTPMRISK